MIFAFALFDNGVGSLLTLGGVAITGVVAFALPFAAKGFFVGVTIVSFAFAAAAAFIDLVIVALSVSYVSSAIIFFDSFIIGELIFV